MRATLQGLCNSFIQNRDVIKENFFWESSNFYPIAAAIFVDKRATATVQRLEQCKNILNNETGFFSHFRDYAKLSIIAMLAVDNYPEVKLRNGLVVYEKLKDYFWRSTYLPVVAMIIADMVEPNQYDELVARTRRIYELMKDNHPFLTAGEDSVFAALLALSPLTEEQIVAETENCYQLLRPDFFSGDAIQSLSHVLALCEGSAEEKCKKTMDLYNALRANGCKYGTSHELATLGVLAMLPVDMEVLVKDIVEVDAFLENQKGYGFFGAATRRERLMHAGMIVTSEYMDDNAVMSTAAISGTISLVAAQQAAMCAAIAASNAAASANANS